MFHSIPQEILERMAYLEAIDAQDRHDGTPHSKRLRQVPPETGKFLALLAAGAPDGRFIEIGTSAGYSTLWLALACRATDRTITTYEFMEGKAEIAQETFRLTGTDDVVNLVTGDAREHLLNEDRVGSSGIAFCFLDGEKEMYSDCYELVVTRLVPGGLFLADNFLSHREALQPLLERILADGRVDSLVVPIGAGVLVCRKS